MTLDTLPDGLVYDFPVATVEVKLKLTDPTWEALPHFYCDKLTLAVNAYDEALLSHELGNTLQTGTAAFDDYQPQELLGHFVRLTLPQTAPHSDLIWVGYIVSTANERSAVKLDGANKKLTGRKQLLRVVGLEYFLDRRQIDSAVIAGETPTTIFRSLAFNKGRPNSSLDDELTNRPNRSPNGTAHPGVTVYEFVEHGETPELWTVARAMNYLLHYFTPVDAAGDKSPCSFLMRGQDNIDGVTDNISPTLDPEGMTVFQCLNKLLAPQRGFVWWTEYDDATNRVFVRVETITSTIITLPSLGMIPANRDQQTLDLESQRDVRDVIAVESGSRHYHQIITRGARMTSTLTLGFQSSPVHELAIDWTDELEVEYDTVPDVTDPTPARNDAARSAERFYRVYNAFRIDPDWDGKSSDGGSAERDWSFPVLSATGSVLDTLPFNVDGLRVLSHTRLKRGWDYSDAANIVETTPQGTEAEYMPAFAIVKIADGSVSGGGQPDKFQFADKLSRTEFDGDNTPVSNDISTSYHVSVQHGVPGIILRPTNGVNHALALNHWDTVNETEHQPEVDYETLRVTCTIEADAYCEAKYPADEDLPAGVPLERLILYVGDEYRLDFLAENTVIDLENGEPQLTNGGVLRDDRKQLQDIARVAYEWYQADRTPVTIVLRNLINVFRLGMLINSIGTGTPQISPNTVVSMIEFDFLNGTTTFKTHDEGLDFAALT